jgi:hypothetical protein
LQEKTIRILLDTLLIGHHHHPRCHSDQHQCQRPLIIIISIFIKIISRASSYTGLAQRDQKIWLFAGDERLTLLLCCIMSFFYKWSSRGRNKKVSGKDEGAAGQPVESERGMWLMSVSTETVSLNIITFYTKNICILVLGNKMSTLTYGLGWAGYQCHPSYQSDTHLKFSLEMMDFLRHIFFYYVSSFSSSSSVI